MYAERGLPGDGQGSWGHRRLPRRIHAEYAAFQRPKQDAKTRSYCVNDLYIVWKPSARMLGLQRDGSDLLKRML